MILTIKKDELLKRLYAAKKREEDRVARENKTIDSDYEKEVAQRVADAEEYLARVKKLQRDGKAPTKKSGGYRYENGFHKDFSSIYKRDPKKPDVQNYETAIYLLERCSEDEVKINTERDNLGITEAIRSMLES